MGVIDRPLTGEGMKGEKIIEIIQWLRFWKDFLDNFDFNRAKVTQRDNFSYLNAVCFMHLWKRHNLDICGTVNFRCLTYSGGLMRRRRDIA